MLTADDAVGPPMVEYVRRGLTWAGQQGAELVILQLNTPGGSIDSMNEMVQLLRNSSIPVVVYVAPSGAMAGSAGTVVVLAGHAAAMAPDTAIGAASPVGSQGEDLGETIQAKVKNILKATVRSLAQGHGPRAVELAEQTIENAAAASADEALAAGMVDFIAKDIPDLLRQLDGFKVQVNSVEQTLVTKDARVETVSESFIEKLLSILTNSAIVFLLITIGVQAILIEISTPGGWVAGFLGVVCLSLAAYGLGVLPVNWFGVVFLILGVRSFHPGYQSAYPRRLDRCRHHLADRRSVGDVQLAQRPQFPARAGAPGHRRFGFNRHYFLHHHAHRCPGAEAAHQHGRREPGWAGGHCPHRSGASRAGAARLVSYGLPNASMRKVPFPAATGWKWSVWMGCACWSAKRNRNN